MKALLIAGGLGTRMRPLTETRPKHLLPIANRPHVDHVLDLLERHGLRDVVLLTSYLADRFAAVVDRARERGLSVAVAHESEPLGTAGALKNAHHLVGDDTFVAMNGDVLTDVDITSLVQFHRDRKADGTILLTRVDDPSAFGVVPTDDDGRVERFFEKPPRDEAPTDLINAGVYVLEPSILDEIASGEIVSIERDVFPSLAAQGRLFARATDAYWMDIGTPHKYLRANLDALDGTFAGPWSDPPQGYLAGPRTEISDSARVSSSCLGEDCAIHPGATVTDCVLLDRVVVGERCRVTDSVLGEGVRVAAGAEVSATAVADDAIIE
ncbi:MAG TPA: NDP-sugar synthase, partial [Actinomycetota bacterium]|nr:NDP-sugar synthase [Actinomycetota bacterium]